MLLSRTLTLVLSEPEHLVYTHQSLPMLRDGEVLVRTRYLGICGSDRLLFRGAYPGPCTYPLVLGHEWSGQVIEAQKGSAFHPGDWVTGDCSCYCGRCPQCEIDRNLCLHIRKFGISIDGACRCHRSIQERYLYRLPSHLPGHVAVWAEPLAVILHGLARFDERSLQGCQALVLGSGPMGLMAAFALAFSRGASVTVVDRLRANLALCTGLDSVQARALDISESTLFDPEYDLVVETTGVPGALNVAVRAARLRGGILCIAPGGQVGLDVDVLVQKGLSIVGSIGGTGHIELALELLSDRVDEAHSLIGQTVHFDRLAEVLPCIARSPVPGKVLVTF